MNEHASSGGEPLGSGSRPHTIPAPTIEQSANDPQKLAATVQYEVGTSTLAWSGDTQDGATRSERPAIAHYEILGELGRGGMGVVYRAKQQGLDRLVAIKMLLAGEHAGPEQLARFQTEAQAVASLQHPNIVQIYEIGEHNGLPFFSLEFVPGGSLSKKIAGKPQSSADSARLVETIARAVQVAPNLGIVHRDLKPANILLAFANHSSASAIHLDPTRQKLLAEGSLDTAIPKISDFGLAKRLEVDSQQTRSGAILGTPSYMSPEQARGDVKEVGPLADVYALGTILYELLTGRPPFLAATAVDTVQQVVSAEPVAPSRLEPNVPRDLETICLKCLQKDPRKRYATAEFLSDDLRRFQQGEPILARPVSAVERLRRWCLRNPRLAIASAASILFLVTTATVTSWSAVTLARKNVVIGEKIKAAIEAQGIAQREAKNAARQQTIAEREAAAATEARDVADKNFELAQQQAMVAIRLIQQVTDQVQTRLSEAPATQAIRKDILDMVNKGLKQVAPIIDSSTSIEVTQLAIHQQLGALFSQLGEGEKAFEEFSKAEAIARQRVVLKQGADGARSNLARTLRDLGTTSQEFRRDMRRALEYYEEALQIRREVVDDPKPGEGKPKPFMNRKELAEDLTRVGATIYRLGDPAAATPHFQRALELRRELMDKFTEHLDVAAATDQDRRAWLSDLKQDLARSLLSVGEMSFRSRSTPQAFQLYSEGVAMRLAMYIENPGTLSFKHELARALGNFGDIYLHFGDVTSARGHYEQSLKLLRDLAALDEYLAVYQRDLGLAHYRLGSLAERSGNAAAAQDHFRASLAVRRALVDLDETNDRRQMELMLALAHCGDHARAAAIAEKYRQRESPDNELLIDVARCLAQCSTTAAHDTGLQTEYAQNAIATLTRAIAQRYRDTVYLECEPDLDPLRERDDFKALLEMARQND